MSKLIVFLLALAIATPAAAEWQRAETPNYVIYSEGNAKTLRDFAIKVERFTTLMRSRLGAKAEAAQTKLTIFMLPKAAAVQSFAKVPNLAGLYRPHPSGPFAVTHREADSVNGQSRADSTLFHELSHHFMFRYANDAYPAWFVEGFAEYYSTATFDKAGLPKVGIPPYGRAYDLMVTKAIPIEALLGAGANMESRGEMGSFYARSWVLTHYLLRATDRAGQLARYLEQISKGVLSLDAAKIAFGDLAKLDDDIDAYIKQRNVTISVPKDPIPEPTNIRIEAMPAAEGAFVPLQLSGLGMRHSEEAATQIDAVKKALVAHPNAAAGWLLLADAEMLAENFSGAEAAADAALKINPKLPRALLAKGWGQLQRLNLQAKTKPEEWKAARSWIVRANRETPDDALILSRYFHSFRVEGLAPSKSARDGLFRAYTLSPEEPNLRMNLALDLVRDKRFDEAITLASPLAYGPHQSAASLSAAALVEQFRNGKAGKAMDAADLGAE